MKFIDKVYFIVVNIVFDFFFMNVWVNERSSDYSTSSKATKTSNEIMIMSSVCCSKIVICSKSEKTGKWKALFDQENIKNEKVVTKLVELGFELLSDVKPAGKKFSHNEAIFAEFFIITCLRLTLTARNTCLFILAIQLAKYRSFQI